MSIRRALLAGVPGVLVTVAITSHGANKHPDAALFALCAQMEQMQVEWQRLYDATSDEDDLTTPADFAWQAYSDTVCRAPKGRS